MKLLENYLQRLKKLKDIAQIKVIKFFPVSGHIGSPEAVQDLPLQLYIKYLQGYISKVGK